VVAAIGPRLEEKARRNVIKMPLGALIVLEWKK
jgi:hypothetical protein